DRAGNRATFARTFTVKTTGPLVEILLGGLLLGTGKTFFAAVTPEVRTNEPLTGPGAATLTVTLDGAPWTPGTAIAAAGSRTLTATVVDATGREATATASFTIDTTTGPALSITSPADGATLPGPTVDLSGTVSAPHPSGATVVRVNGRPATVTGTAWTLAALPLEPDAPNDLVAVAVDALGRTATAAVQVLVRSGAPQVVLISPADGARTNRRRVDLVGAVLGGAAATADGLVRAHGLTAAIDATGAFRLLDLPLAEGPNPLTVTATDSHGRTGEATLTVFSDTTPPAVSFTAAGQPLLDGAVLTAPVTVSIAVDDSGGPIPPPRILLGGAPVEATSPVTDVVISEAGGQVLSVVALDAAGNETRASRSFVVGGGDCSATDVRPVDGSTTPDAKVTLTGRCGSALRLLVRVPQPGGGAPQEYVAAIADGTFAAGDVPLPALGENALELVCEAAAGTPSTTLHRVTRLPAGGPEVSVTSPASGALVASSNVTLSGTVSDETADLFVNGVKVDAAFRAGTSFTQPTVTLTEGPNVLVAKAIDRAGRTGEARVVLQRDTQAPRVTVVWPTSGARFGKRGEAAPVADVTGAVDLASEPHLSSVVVSSPAGSVTATVDPVTGAFRADGLPLGAASGPARVTVLATDAAGHATTVEVDVLVDADVDAPALALNAPTDLSRLTASSPASLPVTGEAWAEEGATVSVNGISLDPATLAWELAAADGRRRVAFATEVAVPAQDGPFGVIVRVEDLAGRSASTRRLLVRDTVAPSVVEIVPAAGATEVDPNGMVLVLFSEELSGPSLTAAGGFRFTRDGQSEPIVGTFTRAGSAVAFVPGAALTPGATYRVVLGAGLTDLAGNPLEPFESTFTVAPALSGTAPAFDPAPPSVLCANALELRGTAPAGSSLRATAGDVSLTATADASGRFLVSLPLLGNGFHAVSVRLVGRDGSLGPAVHALVRKDCSAPLVERAELDREAGRVTVLFSERMSPASLSLSTTPGDGASLLLSLESDPTAAPQAGTLSLDADGVTLRIDLPQAADAWWRDEAVRLTVRPPAADERGNEVTAPYVTTFFPGGGPGDLSGGFLSGEAYDDSTGRPLDGVETRLYASSASLPGVVELPDAPSAVSTTDVRGRYGFFGDVAAGRYVLHLGKSGYTPTLRRLPLAPGSGAVPFDARLTPLSEPSAERLDPAVGGSFEGGAGPAGSGGAGSDGGGTGGTGATGTSGGTGLLLEVAPSPFAPGVPVPPGSLAVRLTPLSAQALPELLPLGWSPLSAADVMLETEGAPSASPSPLPQSARFAPAAVHLTLPLPIHTPPTAALVAVRHDVASGRWLTLGEMDRRAGSGNTDVARIALFSPGAVAVVLADTDPEVAPRTLPPGEGQFLTASILPSPLPALTATLTLDPPVVGPTGRATARVVARSADSVTVWPSGLAVQAWLDEKLVLSGGGELYEAPYTADLVLSHHPVSPEEEAGATPGTFGALTFAVSPSPKASEVLLESGHENVRLYPFPDSLERGSVLGGFGGTVASADGVELTLPEGALAESVAVEATLLTEAELAALTPPAGYDLLAAVRVGFSGRTLARAATLSVPLPEGAPEDPALEARLLLAQLVLQPADGRGAFARLTARATRTTPTGSTPHALCVPEPPGSPLPLEGLLVEGTYLVLRAHAPLGFATGFVRIGSGNGLADSRVSVAASTTPFLGTADLSRPGGRYAIPVPAGADRDVVARHPRLDEAAPARIASLAPSAVVALDLLVQPVGPRVASVQPLDGATDQPITSPLVVRFSEPIDPASVVPGLLTAELLAEDGSATGAFFHGALALQADGATLVFTPTHPFPPGRRIRGRLTSGVRDAGGTPYEGPIPYLWSFTTSTQVQTGGQIDLTKIRIL
ncbi:MAG: Ig-like domain-containing protein, partial [Thermoanaerobaculia bacterium]|nr:Ig-like domain-containing protein [Thermoanaerobaculia bacterium]